MIKINFFTRKTPDEKKEGSESIPLANESESGQLCGNLLIYFSNFTSPFVTYRYRMCHFFLFPVV